MSTNINAAAQEESNKKMPYKEIGSFLSAESSSPSSAYDAKNAANNSGMSGTDSVIHTHTAENAQETMWLSKENELENSFISFDLGRAFQVGKIFVWNYNSAGNTDNGLRKIDVYYSLDGEKWKSFKNFELKKSSDENNIKATNLNDGNLIDLKGVTAQYIKFVPQKKDGNWGGKAYGLSEVRFYQYKEAAVNGSYLTASIYNPVSSKVTKEQHRLVNGVGLSNPSSAKAFHSNNPEDMYLADKAGYIVFDLKGTYPIGAMNIYNYNESSNTKQGLKDVTISTAVEYGKWEKLTDASLKEADGASKLSATDSISFNNKEARFIRLDIKSNYGGDKYGLSAVRFYAGDGYYSEPADEWTGLFSNYQGWSGADGIFAAALDGIETQGFSKRSSNNKTYFNFSDTFISKVNPITRKRQGMQMLNNTSAVFEGNDPYYGKMTFITEENGVPIKPNSERSGYYWLGDVFISNGKAYTFPLYIEKTSSGLGFEQRGEDLASFDIKNGNLDHSTIRLQNDLDKRYLSNFDGGSIIFGSAVLVNTKEAGVKNPDGYIYNYGYMDSKGAKRQLVVSRVKADKIEDFKSYEYYNGQAWVKDIKGVKGLAEDVAPEMSVTPIYTGKNAGKYLLVYTHMTTGNRIVARIGDSPVGPFHESQDLYYITLDSKLGANAFSYNAKGHPVLSEEGELLISYNVNYNGDLAGHVNNADCYRPSFIRLAMTGEAKTDTYDPSKDSGENMSTNSPQEKDKTAIVSKSSKHTGLKMAVILLSAANIVALTYILTRKSKG
ncbi:discoidin domain-containing protein [Clostridium swellfunianum]|uniref:discoidin domain-containing protein n=1 Tax=Clostridium swellfunianum TaxID=1367462 RepID=UPI00202FBE0C|nr:discoidin domain-containing protein [Clostridium swellfunianum]MCM0647316.1 discoidin domain-containing protein [Clostridium swellfunianum]